jgi:hypothetical protein
LLSLFQLAVRDEKRHAHLKHAYPLSCFKSTVEEKKKECMNEWWARIQRLSVRGQEKTKNYLSQELFFI